MPQLEGPTAEKKYTTMYWGALGRKRKNFLKFKIKKKKSFSPKENKTPVWYNKYFHIPGLYTTKNKS